MLLSALLGSSVFSLIFSAGFLPALLWLWLILKEDREHPEPRMRLILSFLAGMTAVIAVVPIQKIFVILFDANNPFLTIILATIEEGTKLALAYAVALHTRDTDEPIDEIIYMVTVALGFAALENSLFLTSSFTSGNLLQGIIIAHARFFGSTLVHVISSGLIGFFLAMSFNKIRKWPALIIGLIAATALHSVYNLLIMSGIEQSFLSAFLGLWISGLGLAYLVNYTKHTVYKNKSQQNE